MALDGYHVLLGVLAFSTAGYALFIALFFLGSRRFATLKTPPRREPAPASLPPVTILKPCAGNDDDLEACLESYCSLNYPAYQVVFGVRDANDAAYPVIERVRARHPELDIAVVLSGAGRHVSPKISNLEVMATRAKYAIVWLSDSNTRVHPDTLADMAERLHRPGVGAVVSPVVGDGDETIGAALDNLQLDAYIGMTAFAIHGATGLVSSPGKSVLLRRETLEAVGGWDELGKYFGEDFILMDGVRKLGLRLALGHHGVANVSVKHSFAKFFARHLRWSQIRWRVVTPATFFELLLSPMVVAFWVMALAPSLSTLGAFLALAALQFACDSAVVYRLRAKPVAARFAWLVLARPVVNWVLLVRGLWSGRVNWRGNELWMGPRSMCLTEPPLRARLRAVRDAVRAFTA